MMISQFKLENLVDELIKATRQGVRTLHAVELAAAEAAKYLDRKNRGR